METAYITVLVFLVLMGMLKFFSAEMMLAVGLF